MVLLPVPRSDELGHDPDGCELNCRGGGEDPYPAAGVRYGVMNWIGEFRLPPNTVVKRSAKVVVQSDRGIELGQQLALTCYGCHPSVRRAQIEEYVDNSGAEFYRLKAGKILREASPQDVDEHGRLNRHVREDVERCAELAAQLNLDMKVITAEHLLGGERIVFYFRSDGRVDFRELVGELAQYYQTRIEMRQVGARDEARLIADYEVCGRECCCKSFLKKLRPVTMRMAKLQKSTLDPTKVSGRCGRLRCCLRYEHEGYDELARRLPRTGTRVQTESGPATVIDRQVLTQLLLVRSDDQRELTVPLEEVSPLGEPAPCPKAAPLESNTDELNADDREEHRRPRRRSRRPQKSSDGDVGASLEPAVPDEPVSETPPAPADSDRTVEAPPEEARELDEEARPPRRRRRPRRRRPGPSPSTDET